MRPPPTNTFSAPGSQLQTTPFGGAGGAEGLAKLHHKHQVQPRARFLGDISGRRPKLQPLMTARNYDNPRGRRAPAPYVRGRGVLALGAGSGERGTCGRARPSPGAGPARSLVTHAGPAPSRAEGHIFLPALPTARLAPSASSSPPVVPPLLGEYFRVSLRYRETTGLEQKPS